MSAELSVQMLLLPVISSSVSGSNVITVNSRSSRFLIIKF